MPSSIRLLTAGGTPFWDRDHDGDGCDDGPLVFRLHPFQPLSISTFAMHMYAPISIRDTFQRRRIGPVTSSAEYLNVLRSCFGSFVFCILYFVFCILCMWCMGLEDKSREGQVGAAGADKRSWRWSWNWEETANARKSHISENKIWFFNVNSFSWLLNIPKSDDGQF